MEREKWGVVESGVTEREGKRSCRGGKVSNAGEKSGSCGVRGDVEDGKRSWRVVVKGFGEWW